ncbi:flavin-containing monooxygenase [Nocardia ignorata]|uniref:Cation diffusion facilitator CzcD-associated flavoprotein CzcO n=1 Tax=Nocardia ignorata TaxID=145285 RepID=A0A4R6P3I8_NOCIG|nr:NAD(P)/FAD-dependent oxidoreductase [Nocardia ignorata]TDP31520.1 cation diffusion facilitator CzcD-associated flavoprotein CzcO [Nocardia ignorata]
MTPNSTRTTGPRRAETNHVGVLIVGAGFSGLGTAIGLLQSGFDDLLVIERDAEVGGTWRDNVYPGCACDVPSRLYSYSFAQKPDWSRRFAPQQEILDYLNDCADDFGVRRHIDFDRALERADWDTERQLWQVQTSAGPLIANVLIMAQGPLSEPVVPRLSGLESFGGPVFHSARWNHQLDLAGLRVGVVGTGASAVQFIPHLQRQAAQVTVFQRTPSWITPRRDRAIPAWRQRLNGLLPVLDRISRAWEYWLRELSVPGLMGNKTWLEIGRREAQEHLRKQVSDPILRAALTPDYDFGCKRVLLSDDYYPALTQPNVSIVTQPIDRVEPGRVVTNGANAEIHDVDVLIFGTGFHVTDSPFQRIVFGTDKRSLEEAWRDGQQAYKGTTVSGFPNLFLMAGPNTGVGHTSLIYMIESQIAYLISCLTMMRSQGVAAVDVRVGVQAAYNAGLQQSLEPSVWASGGCVSWYQDHRGNVTTIWPGHTWRYRRETAAFDPQAYELIRADAVTPV